MAERMARCKTCRFWEHSGENAEGFIVGTCRRFPPVFMERQLPKTMRLDVGIDSGMWPDTDESDWCGEWKPKEPDACG